MTSDPDFIGDGKHPYDPLPSDRILSVTPAPFTPPPSLPDAQQFVLQLTDNLTKPPVGALPQDGDLTGELNLFSRTVFGRDSLINAATLELIPEFDGILGITIEHHARRQGLTLDEHLAAACVADAEEVSDQYRRRGEFSGGVVHEDRDPADPRAAELSRENGWAWPYFGTADAPILVAKFLIQMALEDPFILDHSVTQRDGVDRTLAQVLNRSLDWCRQNINNNPEGLFEVERPPLPANSPAVPIAYPTWMDSPDANTRIDGSLCTGPLALAELQGDMYDTLVGVGKLAEKVAQVNPEKSLLYQLEKPEIYLAEAMRLRHSVITLLDIGSDVRVAYATERMPDGSVMALDVRKSNASRLLGSQILVVDPKQSNRDDAAAGHLVEAIINQTYDPSQGMVAPTGVRTESALSAHYQPGGYHNGAIWPHDNSLIADGTEAHGYLQLALWHHRTVVKALEDLRHYAELYRGDGYLSPTENSATIRVMSRDPFYGNYQRTSQQRGQPNLGWPIVFYLHSQQRIRQIEQRLLDMSLSGSPYRESRMELELLARLDQMRAVAA